jgi:hypothetical protein
VIHAIWRIASRGVVVAPTGAPPVDYGLDLVVQFRRTSYNGTPSERTEVMRMIETVRYDIAEPVKACTVNFKAHGLARILHEKRAVFPC